MSGAGVVKLGTAGFVVWFGIQYADVMVKTKDSVETTAAGVDLHSLDKFLQQYGALPDTRIPFPPDGQQQFEDILVTMVEVHGERKPYEDQWGRPYKYTHRGPEAYDIACDGKDGKAGTDDDLLLTRRGPVVKLNIDLRKMANQLVDEELARKKEQARTITELQQSVDGRSPGDAQPPAGAGETGAAGATPSEGTTPPGGGAAPAPAGTPATGEATDQGWVADGQPAAGTGRTPAPTAGEQRRANGLLQKARAEAALKHAAEARKIYQQIQNLYPNTLAAQQARRALAALDGDDP